MPFSKKFLPHNPMRPLSLSPRLLTATQWIRPTDRVADIGTDHARLPVYLMEHRLCAFAAAVDIAEGPLERARRTIATHNLTDVIPVIRSDGAANLSPDGFDVLVVTGMGGETILEILARSPWTATKRLILGANSHVSQLLRGLTSLGITPTDGELVVERHRVYMLIYSEQ